VVPEDQVVVAEVVAAITTLPRPSPLPEVQTPVVVVEVDPGTHTLVKFTLMVGGITLETDLPVVLV
jgi:hypothetical protein